MKHRKRLKTYLLIAIPLSIVFYFIIYIRTNTHHSSWDNQKEYLWLFTDSAIKDIDPHFQGSWVKDNDILCHFIYKEHFLVSIWHFDDLDKIKLTDAVINYDKSTQDIDIMYGKGEVLNSKSSLQTAVRFGRNFDNRINVNLSKNSTIQDTFQSSSYKGFLGTIDGMSFTNSKFEDYIYFRYPDGRMQTLLVLYKSARGFFIIQVETNDPEISINKELVNIFNLT